MQIDFRFKKIERDHQKIGFPPSTFNHKHCDHKTFATTAIELKAN